MNEFVINPVKLTPQQMVLGVMGISMSQLVNDILENRDGIYDRLYIKAAPATRDSKNQ